MLIFYWPWFALLIPFAILYWLLLFKSNLISLNSTPNIRFPHANILVKHFKFQGQGGEGSKRSEKILIFLLSLLWLSLVASLMRPQKVESLMFANEHGHDMMLAVDISESMLALDFEKHGNRKTRLDVTKEVVSEFVSKRKGDRLGLILFAEKSYLQVPMTMDLLSLSKMLNNSFPGMAGPSTSIGDAIGLSVLTLRERPPESRILILLTDGEDNSSKIPPMQAAKMAADYKIKIYTIGIGAPGNKTVPYIDGYGIRRNVTIPMDEQLLKDISSKTGGRYFLASNINTLKGIYDEINKLEKIDLSVQEYMLREPLYRYPLSLSAIIFALIVILPLLNTVLFGKSSLTREGE